MLTPENVRLFLIVMALLFLLGVLKRPFYGLLSYTLIMMIRPGLFYPSLGRIELFVGLLLIAVIIFSGRLVRLKVAEEPIVKWTFIFMVVVTVSVVQAFDFTTAWEHYQDFIKVFIFFIMIVTLIDDRKDLSFFLWTFCLATLLIGYSAIYNFHQGIIVEAQGDSRTNYAVADKGMGSGHVALANIILQCLPFIWFLGIRNSKFVLKVLAGILFGIGIYAIFVAGSRGGMVGLVALVGFLIYFAKKRALSITFALVVGVLLLQVMGSSYQDYMKTILQFGDSGVSAESRVTGLKNGLEMMIKRPILGVGIGCYSNARRAWFGWGLWAHNHYGQLIGELGIIGTIVWFKFLFSYLMQAWNMRRDSDTGDWLVRVMTAVVVATAVRLVVGMGTHSLYIFFWYMAAGVVVVAVKLSKQRT